MQIIALEKHCAEALASKTSLLMRMTNNAGQVPELRVYETKRKKSGNPVQTSVLCKLQLRMSFKRESAAAKKES